MPEHDFIQVFTSRLNKLAVSYMVTGAVVATIYGEPRLTHDIDLVIDLKLYDIEKFVDAFYFIQSSSAFEYYNNSWSFVSIRGFLKFDFHLPLESG